MSINASDSGKQVDDGATVTPEEPKDKRVHILVQKTTHEMLEQTRAAMRMNSVVHVPEPIRSMLLREWTADVLVAAGCAAIQHLLKPAEGAGGDAAPPAKATKKGKR